MKDMICYAKVNMNHNLETSRVC